ncbi:MAG: hypothetical protein R2747_13800 [Pyrinomonadaceae bacterium]
MKEQVLKILSAKLTAAALWTAVLLSVLAGTALAEKINLTLKDAPLTIPKDTTVTKNINGIPFGTPGNIDLRIKWHVMTFIPNVFNKLKIELIHGSSVLVTKTCYSVHSNKEPKCFLFKAVNQLESDIAGTWKLRITNNTSDDVNGFNILKEITDINPTVSAIQSTFEPDCSPRNLTLQGGGKVKIAGYSSVERELYGIQSRGGHVTVRGKWHTDVITPNVFVRLKVELLRNGSVVKTDYGYSIHSDQKDKLNLKYDAPAGPSNDTWKLKISNSESSFLLKDFNIEKGFDLNPLVPSFTSTFKPCS